MSLHSESNPKAPSGWKSALKRAWPTIRILLSIGLLWKATSGIDWHAIFESEIQMEPWWFLVALLSATTACLCGGLRWAFLMRKSGFQGRLRSYILL